MPQAINLGRSGALTRSLFWNSPWKCTGFPGPGAVALVTMPGQFQDNAKHLQGPYIEFIAVVQIPSPPEAAGRNWTRIWGLDGTGRTILTDGLQKIVRY